MTTRIFFLAAMLWIVVSVGVKAQERITREFSDIPLAEALAVLRDSQSEYTFHFIHNDLEHLKVTSVLKYKNVADAVKQLCEDMPVKVKVKRKNIFVQYRKEEDMTGKMVSIQCDVFDGFLEMPLPYATMSILNADSSVVVDSTNRIIPGE